VPQRAETTLVPVLGTRIERENLRLESGRNPGAEAVSFARHRIRRQLVLKWKTRFCEHAEGIHQRETLVESGIAGAPGFDKRGVEDFAITFIDGEALVDDLAQRASRL
jgi:hypothetical protein